MNNIKIESSAPGRICLFGEHQDYMGLPVITAAIDLRIKITGKISDGKNVDVLLPDTKNRVNFECDNIKYSNDKDYLKSGIKVLADQGIFKNRKIEAILKGNMPIKAGISSSSALSVAWVSFLLSSFWSLKKINDNRDKIGEFAYISEVEEFGESGGRMDQYASSFGGINYFSFQKKIKTESFPVTLGGFVLGDSEEPKDTQKTLRRIRGGQEEGLRELSKYMKFIDNFSINYDEAEPSSKKVSHEVRPFLEAVLLNHRITKDARLELQRSKPRNDAIASLMNLHHSVLRDKLNLTTKKIDKMVDLSLKAGALSAKINGSGEGGCMFAYCPGYEEEVSEAIRSAGGVPYKIKVDEGAKVKFLRAEK